MIKILIAVKDREAAIIINNFIQEIGYVPTILIEISELIKRLSEGNYNILFIDSDFLQEFELNLGNFIKDEFPQLQVIVIAKSDKKNLAIDIAEKNNFFYLECPVNINELKYVLKKVVDEIEKQKTVDLSYFENKFVGKSEKILKIKNLIKKIAKNDSNVLIIGETGTGKELVARAIYEMSHRANGVFVTINCAAIPENLIEAELFGYKKGAFTGATSDKKGLIELADNGTLFLDEIGDLSLNLQAKLLRVLEYKELRPLGDEKVKKVNVRVIAATNQDLAQLVKEKKFREDLFFRLNVVLINLPPLRERREDIPLLIRFFIEKYNRAYNKNIIGIEPRARIILAHYDYPGNVRELENIIQHAVIFCEKDTITVEDLPANMQNISVFNQLEEHKEENVQPASNFIDKELNLAEVEKRAILKAFEKYGNNHTKVAKILGISRSTLWRKIKEHNLMIEK